GDVDLSQVPVDLDADHVVTCGSDLTADADRPDVRAGLDAQGDRLEGALGAVDGALALAALGGEGTRDRQDREGLAHLDADGAVAVGRDALERGLPEGPFTQVY